jgi:hypothetical protein
VGLDSLSRKEYGAEYDMVILEQWKTCVEMANSNTEKRTNSNNIFITINAALLAVISFSLEYKSIILSVVGIAVCAVWLCSIDNYKKLSSVKYDIVNEIELAFWFLALTVCAVCEVVYAAPLSMVSSKPSLCPLLANVKL